MKKLTKFAMMFLCGAFALGFTSCSDDDDKPADSDDVILSESAANAMTSNYVSTVVNPTYSDLHNAAVTLHSACAQLYQEKQAGNVTQATINAACEAFKTARKYWEQSEAFLYGPATNDGIDPHMDSWPLDQTQMAEALTNAQLITGISGSDGAHYVYVHNGDFDSTLGFHGLEYILFRNGENRTAAAFNAEMEDGSGLNPKGTNAAQNAQTLQKVTTLSEAAFANAVSGDLQNMTALLEYEWDGLASLGTYLQQSASWVYNGAQNLAGILQVGRFYGDQVANLYSGSEEISSYPKDIANIIEGCRSICEEVHVQKIGQAYRIATGDNSGHTGESGEHEEDAADYIESPYSKRSFQDYQDNIYSIKNSLYGVRGTETISTPPTGSIMAFLIANYPDGQDLSNKLNAAIASFETAKANGAFIDNPGSSYAKAAMDACTELDDALNAAESWCEAHIIIR